MSKGAGGETYLVAQHGSTIVGYAALRRSELTALFVHPRVAGRGVGSLLVDRMKRLARQRGANRLFVLAAKGSEGFYASCGFSPGAPTEVSLPGGLKLPALRMSLELREEADGEPKTKRRAIRRGASRPEPPR